MAKAPIGNVIDIYISAEKPSIPFYTYYSHSPGAMRPNLYIGKVNKKLWEDYVDQFNVVYGLYKKIQASLEMKGETLKF